MHTRVPLACCLALALSLPACKSAQSSAGSADQADPKPIADLVERSKVPEPIGKLIGDLDLRIRAWTKLKMTAATPEDRNKARELEKIIATAAHTRRAELVEQLEGGPSANRVVAASALGFSKDPEVLSPLLACLDDQNPELVGNALLGLMLLGSKETPLERICERMRNDSDPWVRTNAAQCLSNLVQAGAQSSCVQLSGRLGLTDPEPGVRSHCALMLATLLDTQALPAMLDLVHDPVPLVSSAAVQALVWIARHDDPSKGRVARELAGALGESRNPLRAQLLRGLTELSGVGYGNEAKEWVEWAGRLP